MENNSNHNIFAGDKRYKTDIWLRFLEKQSLFKYRKFVRRRAKHLINSFSWLQQLIMLLIIWGMFSGTSRYLLVSLFLILWTISSYSYNFILNILSLSWLINSESNHRMLSFQSVLGGIAGNDKSKTNPLGMMMVQTLVLLFLLVYVVPLKGESTPIIYFYLSPFIILQSFGRSWIEYGILSIILNYIIQLSMIDVILSIWLYGFLERIFKEMWVIGDSNK